MYSLSFTPLVPVWLLAALALVVLAAAGAALVLQRGRGVLRALALLALLFALGDPSLVHEEREPVKDVVAVVIDRSGSNRLADRAEQTARARAQVERQLAGISQVEARFVEVGDGDGANDGTRLFEALSATLADVPAERVAGALFITDGIVHDMPGAAQALGLKAPLHALITGRDSEIDRRVTLTDTPRFGIVGKTVKIRLTVDEKNGTGTSRVTVRRDGEVLMERAVRTAEPMELTVRIDRGGPNLIEIEADAIPGEMTTANNRAVVTIEGVRDKLRVLLVSGEPHAGERTWRNLLKSDANIDLVHFTILRPPEKQDGTPINELSLIAFPVRDLFQTKIKEFDLIIFDRYANTTILPLVYFENIVRYVREGGALMVAAGPEFSGNGTLSRTPLSAVLPAQPDGRTIEEAYRARITDRGKRHPVTRDLDGSEVEPPRWGEWLRLISARASEGDVVMSGPGDRPLLITSREGKGRVGLFLSDHAWLWARGYREGGPHIDLLRRLSHWLMKEPSLEEEALRATTRGRTVEIERQTLGDNPGAVTITSPSGAARSLPLALDRPGLFSTRLQATELGLHRLQSDQLVAFVSVGSDNPREFTDVLSDPARLRPVAETLGGSSRRIGSEASPEVQLPRVVPVRAGARLAGGDWIGLRITDSGIVRGVSLSPLFIGLGGLALILGALIAGWLGEGGSRHSRRKAES
ncbi:MAG: hypothetical protein HEQ16_15580 [Bosea sp.]|jgi:hypothetical protein|nr:hypothetical protein [Bosea sp. (in: a-proteobacteria)]